MAFKESQRKINKEEPQEEGSEDGR